MHVLLGNSLHGMTQASHVDALLALQRGCASKHSWCKVLLLHTVTHVLSAGACPHLPAGAARDDYLSTHEKRLRRLQDMVSELETEALAEKGWQLRGEIGAQHRPLNSALEVDLDFETTNR